MRKINAQYNVVSSGSLPDQVAAYVRKSMYAEFIKQGVEAHHSILDVGVTSDRTQVSSNYLESWHPTKSSIVACGIDDAAHLIIDYPGVRYVRANGLQLPFADESFDFVHSSAVLEHVGCHKNQSKFISELHRVARKGVFVTTPNRWFPIEFHSLLPLVHWLPPKHFRSILRALGHHDLAKEENLNLLDRNEVVTILADAGVFDFNVKYAKLLFWPSNLLISIQKRPVELK